MGTSHQFPIFFDGRNRIKHLGAGGSRYTWWLRSAHSGASTYAATFGRNGNDDYNNASSISVGAPVCFRISA